VKIPPCANSEILILYAVSLGIGFMRVHEIEMGKTVKELKIKGIMVVESQELTHD
jgi:hypothetical protein